MASTETSALAFRNDLMDLVHNIVWKDAFTAMRYEDPQYSIEVDTYVTAASSLMEHYSTNQLVNMLSYDDTRFKSLVSSLDIAYQRPLWILRNYHEHNDYYRMLAGLPPENVTVYGERASMAYSGYAISLNEINLPAIQKAQFQQSTNYGEKIEYIHQMTPDQCLYLETHGYLDEDGINRSNIIATDKKYRYLDHLTSKRVYPFVARLADRFSLLYSPSTKLPSLGESFQTQYEASRIYMIQRYYTEAYKNRYEFYEGFMGLAILFMTIQQWNVGYLDTDITRDFFDMDSIKIVYAAYSVPFYPSIPSDYHLKIVKLINRLLSYKGSNHVFFDLAALFDYDKLSIYQYYLMKRQKLNGDGSPHFEYDYTYDHRGIEIDRQINYPGSYDFSFVKRTIGGESPFDAVNDENNYVDYNEVINADHYWLDDGDLRDKMYKSEYNYIETKYIGMQMQLSVSEFFYENIFFVRMLMDNRDVFEKLSVTYSKTGTDIDLFTLIIYMHALIVKKLGWTGEFVLHPAKVADSSAPSGFRSIYRDLYTGIPTEATKVAKIRGFNFKDDMQTIVNELIVSSQRNTVRVTRPVTSENDIDGWYLYPIANTNTRNNSATGINSKSIWESMDVEVYSIKNGTIIEKLGTVKDFDCHGIVGGIGASVTYDTLTTAESTTVGANVERNNIKDVVYRCMYEAVYTTGTEETRARQAQTVVDTFKIVVSDASVNLFEGNDTLEMHSFLDMLMDQNNIANATLLNGTIAKTMNNITAIKKFINNKMTSTKDHTVYMAYKHLYQVLMTIEVLPEVIEKKNTPHYDVDNPIYKTDSDGNYVYDSDGNPVIEGYPILDTPNLAVSFEDLLEDINNPLEIHLMSLTTEADLNDEIDYCLITLQNFCTEMKYLRSYGTYNVEVIIEYLYKLIKFFKSVKVQLINFKVIYLFDSETDNMLKFMDELTESVRSYEMTDDSFVVSLFDTIDSAYKTKLIDDEIIPKDLLIQYLSIIVLKDVVLKDGIPLRRVLSNVWCAIDIFDDYKHLETIRLVCATLKTLSGMLEDYLYRPITTSHLQMTIRYNDTIQRTIEMVLSDVITFTDAIVSSEVLSTLDSCIKLSATIPHLTKIVEAGHPSQKYTVGYFLYDDRKGAKQILNETGAGLLGNLEADAIVIDDSYVGMINALDINVDPSVNSEAYDDNGDYEPSAISVDDDKALSSAIGIWSTSVPEAIRFTHDYDLGGTWATLTLTSSLLSSGTTTGGNLPSKLGLTDALIEVEHIEHDQFGLGIPINGNQGILTATFTNDNNEDEERVLSVKYEDQITDN